MKKRLFAVVGVLALLTLPALADPTVISTIDGYYGQFAYDTPELTISNTTAYDFTNASLTLTGYQGENNGVTQSQSISNITAGTTYLYNWGQNPTGSLFAYDYDDTGGNSQAGNPLCVQPIHFALSLIHFALTRATSTLPSERRGTVSPFTRSSVQIPPFLARAMWQVSSLVGRDWIRTACLRQSTTITAAVDRMACSRTFMPELRLR